MSRYFLAGVAIVLLFAGGVHAAPPWHFRVVQNNDFLADNTVDDDFYTFGIRLELSYGALSYRLTENAFTDREDDARFDETYLTVGRLLPDAWLGAWNVWVELGAVHVGEGLLGQSAQNQLHELVGVDPVHLEYLEGVDDYHAHVTAELGRQWRLARHWTAGPRIGFSTSIGFRTNSLAGVRTVWKPSRRFAVDVVLGARFADTELPLLEPHLEKASLAAMVELDLPFGFLVEWSLNRYGTERRHLSFGWSIGGGRSPQRRQGAWVDAEATP